TIVTGFLGAGKTTLVRAFLESPQGRGTVVIVNEFGAIGIDDALVRDSAEATVLLGNGCACCVTRSDLQVALHRLIAERDRGLIPPFGRIVIETSGLADPGPILQTFATDRALGAEFHAEVALAVVDAVTGAETLDWSPEARKQVMLADRLVVSKTDLADAAATEQLILPLADLNPRAEIATAANGALDPDCLIEEAAAAPARNGFAAEAIHVDGIVSFVLTETVPLEWMPFARAM